MFLSPCDDGYHRQTAPVGRFLPNAYGLYDMQGNVSEWCFDWFSDTYYEVSPRENPQGPSHDSITNQPGGPPDPRYDNERVKRGANWAREAGSNSDRWSWTFSDTLDDLEVRLVMARTP